MPSALTVAMAAHDGPRVAGKKRCVVIESRIRDEWLRIAAVRIGDEDVAVQRRKARETTALLEVTRRGMLPDWADAVTPDIASPQHAERQYLMARAFLMCCRYPLTSALYLIRCG